MKRLAVLPILALLVPTACGGDSFSNAVVPAETQQDAGPEPSVITGGKKEAPPGCDGAKLPTQDACVIDEGLGIFVSKSLGKDDGDGTRAKPFATLQKAITVAAVSSKRVYACAESYSESIVLAEGVSLFGNIACANGWNVDAARHATIVGTTVPTVKASKLTAPLRIEALYIEGPAATQPSSSSIALIAVDVKALVVANSALMAKKAAAGAKGLPGPTLTNGTDVDGTNAKHAGKCAFVTHAGCQSYYSNNPGGTNTCLGASGIEGGRGGDGGYGGYYQKTTTLTKVEDPTAGYVGGANTGSPGNGTVTGAAGLAGPDGVDGKSSTGGVITADGWVPGDGTAGTNGKPGQGGGGGGGGGMTALEATSGGDWFGNTGSGGGAGGCPGTAGTAGKGGGASIGLISWTSVVRLEATTVSAGDGGDGGEGDVGTVIRGGGRAGATKGAYPQTAGGNGGMGGWAGTSGHGAGGHSIGVAFKGALPDLGGATPTTGTFGKGQSKDDYLSYFAPLLFPKSIKPSPDGIAQKLVELP